VYFDTPEGELRHRGARCRIRFTAHGAGVLAVSLPGGRPLETRVRGAETADALDGRAGGESAPGRQLRALIDPARLAPWLELEVDGRGARCAGGWCRCRCAP
jgi:hypothetical protein